MADKAASLSDKSLPLTERKPHAVNTYDLRATNPNIVVPQQLETMKNTTYCDVSTELLLRFHVTLLKVNRYLNVQLIS